MEARLCSREWERDIRPYHHSGSSPAPTIHVRIASAQRRESQCAMDGKSEHVDMSTHNDLTRLASMERVGRIYFDQCVFGASLSYTTQVIDSGKLLSQLQLLFAKKFCPHSPGTHNSIVGKIANGAAYRTRAAQSYPAKMIAAFADAIVALLPPAAGVRDAGGAGEDDWCENALHDIFTLGNESDAD
eukprot:6192520-Pleurochrysis_carterae.AAC.1